HLDERRLPHPRVAAVRRRRLRARLPGVPAGQGAGGGGMTTIDDCTLITLPKVTARSGNLTAVTGGESVPFEIARVYYLYDVPGQTDEVRVPFTDLATLHAPIASELTEAIGRVVQRSWYVLGEEVAAFEAEFAAYCGTDHCVGVGSGTEALHLALLACGVGPG